MHEMSIAQSLIDIIKEEMTRHHLGHRTGRGKTYYGSHPLEGYVPGMQAGI